MKDTHDVASDRIPRRRRKPAKKEGPTLPPASDWRATDEDEINRRRERASSDTYRVRNLDGRHPIFSNFQIESPSGGSYSVEVRDLAGRVFSCTCTDFRINGLGTCKHIEALLLQLPRRDHGAYREAKLNGSTRVDIVPLPGTDRLQIERGLGVLGRRTRALFDAKGVLRPEIETAEALEILAAAEETNVRISQEVAPWLEAQTRIRDRVLARREYERQVAGGIAPQSETKAQLFRG